MFGNLKGRADTLETQIDSAVQALKAMAAVVIAAMAVAVLAIIALGVNRAN
jgi:ABC-type molybdate transport system permease subunit